MIPYENEQVTEILIEGHSEWIAIKKGSFQAVKVGEHAHEGVIVVEKYTSDQIFFFAETLKAVKFRTDEVTTTSGIGTADGRLLP